MGKLLGMMATAGKGAWYAMGLGGAAAAVDVVRDNKDGYVSNFLSDTYTTILNSKTESGVDSGFQGFYKFFEKIADLIESFTGEGSVSGLRNWALEGQGKESQIAGTTGSDAATSETDVTQSAQLDWGDGVSFAAPATAFAVGVRSVPVLASVFAGADALWDTGAYALKGEFGNAGARLAGGAVETISGLGGGLTYAFGVAGREAIENGSNALFDTTVPDSELASLAKTGASFFLNND